MTPQTQAPMPSAQAPAILPPTTFGAPSAARLESMEREILVLSAALAQCRDAFEIPAEGEDARWLAAQSSPEAIPEFVLEQVEALHAQATPTSLLHGMLTAMREQATHASRISGAEAWAKAQDIVMQFMPGQRATPIPLEPDSTWVDCHGNQVTVLDILNAHEPRPDHPVQVSYKDSAGRRWSCPLTRWYLRMRPTPN